LLATNVVDGFVESFQKPGSITFAEGRGSAGNLSQFTQFGEQISGCKGRPDIVFCKRLARRSEHRGPFRNAPGCKRDVRRDHDVIRLHVFDNPVVGGIHPLVNNLEGHTGRRRDSHPTPGDQSDTKTVALCHSINFLLHGTSIGVYENMQQPDLSSVLCPKAGGIIQYQSLTQFRALSQELLREVRTSLRAPDGVVWSL
jgi:hypothetical protein